MPMSQRQILDKFQSPMCSPMPITNGKSPSIRDSGSPVRYPISGRIDRAARAIAYALGPPTTGRQLVCTSAAPPGAFKDKEWSFRPPVERGPYSVRTVRIRIRLFSSEVLDELTQEGLGSDFLDQLGAGRNPLFNWNHWSRWFSDPGSNPVQAVQGCTVSS
jgi:hypothetical protein